MTKKFRNYAIVAAGSLVLVCFMAGNSMAWGPNHNNFGPGYHGMGYMGSNGGPNFDNYLVDKGVPAATVNAYMAEKNKFRTESAAAFENMRAKGLELYEEMSKATPDVTKAKALQDELSKLRADFDAKRIEHQLAMKTAYPQICEIMQQDFQNKGFGMGKPGPGFHHNNGFGPGFHHNNGPGPRP